MYENPKFNQNNEKILCERNGKNSDMLMDIRVKILKAGETMTFCEAENETALLLMAGDVDFVFDGKTENAKRRSPFLDKATAIHFARNNTVTVKANEESRIVIEQTDNSNDFGVHYYKGEDMTVQHFGADQWDGTADRQVLTVFDYENAPYSNLVLGEVSTSPAAGQAIRRIIIRSPRSTTTNLISLRASASALTETIAIRWVTRAVFA